MKLQRLKNTYVQIRMSSELAYQIKSFCKSNEITISSFVRWLVEDFFEAKRPIDRRSL